MFHGVKIRITQLHNKSDNSLKSLFRFVLYHRKHGDDDDDDF